MKKTVVLSKKNFLQVMFNACGVHMENYTNTLNGKVHAALHMPTGDVVDVVIYSDLNEVDSNTTTRIKYNDRKYTHIMSILAKDIQGFMEYNEIPTEVKHLDWLGREGNKCHQHNSISIYTKDDDGSRPWDYAINQKQSQYKPIPKNMKAITKEDFVVKMFDYAGYSVMMYEPSGSHVNIIAFNRDLRFFVELRMFSDLENGKTYTRFKYNRKKNAIFHMLMDDVCDIPLDIELPFADLVCDYCDNHGIEGVVKLFDNSHNDISCVTIIMEGDKRPWDVWKK